MRDWPGSVLDNLGEDKYSMWTEWWNGEVVKG